MMSVLSGHERMSTEELLCSPVRLRCCHCPRSRIQNQHLADQQNHEPDTNKIRYSETQASSRVHDVVLWNARYATPRRIMTSKLLVIDEC